MTAWGEFTSPLAGEVGGEAAGWGRSSFLSRPAGKKVPLTTYRVTLKEGKLTAEMVKDKKRGAAAPARVFPLVGFGLSSAISLGWFGIWFARRQDRYRS